MPKSDWELFNCSEEWESGYVRNQYKDSELVKHFLQSMCEKKRINNSTHAQIYDLLKGANFKKK